MSDSVFKHKYENKYDINDIRSYLIRFHPYVNPIGMRANLVIDVERAKSDV
jgi:hypothetical protein